MREALQRLGRPEPGEGVAVTPALLDRVAERLLREVDPIHGGIGTAPKFPQCGIFELLWRAWKRTGTPAYRDAVLRTLTNICQGGIYDHLGGGFARYSTDQRWLAPHFEKMLYDNAELVDLLTLVWEETREPLYAQRIAETIGWLEREMLTAEGGFASSLDADSEHEEGKFYVWSEAEIDAVLGDRTALLKQFYDVSSPGNWEGHTILNRLHRQVLADPETEAELARYREALFQVRAPRSSVLPHRRSVPFRSSPRISESSRPTSPRCSDKFQIPGTRVLQFAFDGNPGNVHLPHNCSQDCIVYTGTHDNSTTRDWFERLSEPERQRVWAYLKRPPGHNREAAVWEGWMLRSNGYTRRGRRVEPGEILNVRFGRTVRRQGKSDRLTNTANCVRDGKCGLICLGRPFSDFQKFFDSKRRISWIECSVR